MFKTGGVDYFFWLRTLTFTQKNDMKIKAWISTFRLRTLPLSLSGIILGSFIAFKIGEWNSLIFIFSVLTTVLFQIVSNLANDFS